MSDREWARARVAARAFLRDNYPDAQWDAIDDLSRALTHEAETDVRCVHCNVLIMEGDET